jgi:hypothetical protein
MGRAKLLKRLGWFLEYGPGKGGWFGLTAGAASLRTGGRTTRDLRWVPRLRKGPRVGAGR